MEIQHSAASYIVLIIPLSVIRGTERILIVLKLIVKKKKKKNGVKLDAYNIIKMIFHGFQCDEFSLSHYKESIARKLYNRV